VFGFLQRICNSIYVDIRKLNSRVKGKLPSASTSEDNTPKDTFAAKNGAILV